MRKRKPTRLQRAALDHVTNEWRTTEEVHRAMNHGRATPIAVAALRLRLLSLWEQDAVARRELPDNRRIVQWKLPGDNK